MEPASLLDPDVERRRLDFDSSFADAYLERHTRLQPGLPAGFPGDDQTPG